VSGAVLLVEDNQSHAELMRDELEDALEGWTLEGAASLAEARRSIATRR
jgi:hypothetical protein